MTRDDPDKLPLRVVIWLDLTSLPPPDERLREECRGSVRDGLVEREGGGCELLDSLRLSGLWACSEVQLISTKLWNQLQPVTHLQSSSVRAPLEDLLASLVQLRRFAELGELLAASWRCHTLH